MLVPSHLLAKGMLPSQIEISSGASIQSLAWSISGNAQGQNPNILSELKWDGLKGIDFMFNPRWKLVSDLQFSLPFGFCSIIAGRVTDSDYEGDNRASRVFFFESSCNNGSAYSAFPNLGWPFFLTSNFVVVPRIGFVFHSQHLFLKNDFPSFDEKPLNSSYIARWAGPGFSVETLLTLFCRMKMGYTINYHQIRYVAKANWNLIESLAHPVSFTHEARGFGLEQVLVVRYPARKGLELVFRFNSSHWSTGYGIDKLFKADGSSVLTRLNDVSRYETKASLGLNFIF